MGALSPESPAHPEKSATQLACLRHRSQFLQLFEPVQNNVNSRDGIRLSNNLTLHHLVLLIRWHDAA